MVSNSEESALFTAKLEMKSAVAMPDFVSPGASTPVQAGYRNCLMLAPTAQAPATNTLINFKSSRCALLFNRFFGGLLSFPARLPFWKALPVPFFKHESSAPENLLTDERSAI